MRQSRALERRTSGNRTNAHLCGAVVGRSWSVDEWSPLLCKPLIGSVENGGAAAVLVDGSDMVRWRVCLSVKRSAARRP